MLLLFTSSGDGTSDRIVHSLGNQVFRFNFDQISEFRTFITPQKWQIESPTGRVISSDNATSAFWWKAFTDRPDQVDPFIYSESKYIFHELYAWFIARKLAKGNPITFHNTFGKIQILGLASKYFLTPKTVFTWSTSPDEFVDKNSRIVKSLSSALMADGRSLFTTDVSNRSLDVRFPWLTQDKINGSHDVTVLIVKDRLFAFKRDRSSLKGLDWRAEQSFDDSDDGWSPFALSSKDISAFQGLASDMGTDWGRFDLMMLEDSSLIFLEFNANGQWVFLDYHNRVGMIEAVSNYLLPL